MKINYKILFILFFLPIFVYSQENCTNSLKRAQKLYEEGVMEEIIGLLTPCMKGGFSSDEKTQAYKLIINTYLAEDNQKEAEAMMMKFLGDFPEYRLVSADPVEFRKLFESIITAPVFSIGITGGLNYSMVRVIENYGISNLDKTKSSYVSGLGFQIGARFNKYLIDNLELTLEVLYLQNSFEISKDVFDFSKVTMTEKQSRLEFPLSIRYDIGKGMLKPFARAGFSWGMLNSATLTPKRTNNGLNNTKENITGSDIAISNQRNKNIFSLLIAGGIKYKIPRGNLIFEVRYSRGLNQAVNSDERYSNPDLLYKYFYADDNYKLDYLSFSLGYTFSFYKQKTRSGKNKF